MMRPIKVPSQDALDDQMVGASGCAHSSADIDFPLRGDEQIYNRENLLLLVVQRNEVPELTVIRVILHTDVVVFRRCIRESRRWTESDSVRGHIFVIRLHLGSCRSCRRRNDMDIPDHGRVDRPVPASNRLIYDGHDLP